jgi:hypothetical protein
MLVLMVVQNRALAEHVILTSLPAVFKMLRLMMQIHTTAGNE